MLQYRIELQLVGFSKFCLCAWISSQSVILVDIDYVILPRLGEELGGRPGFAACTNDSEPEPAEES